MRSESFCQVYCRVFTRKKESPRTTHSLTLNAEQRQSCSSLFAFGTGGPESLPIGSQEASRPLSTDLLGNQLFRPKLLFCQGFSIKCDGRMEDQVLPDGRQQVSITFIPLAGQLQEETFQAVMLERFVPSPAWLMQQFLPQVAPFWG